MRRANPDVPCSIVDRRRLRELEAEERDAIWAAVGVVIMSIDFAKREDVTEILTQTTWDLLVVDEAHQLASQTQRQRVVSELIEHCPEMRVLYLRTLSQTLAGEEKDNPLFKDIETTVWSRETVHDRDGMPLLPEVQIEWIRHKRQPDEAAVLTQLQESLQAIAGFGQQGRFIGTLLLKAASSSLFALEQQLNRMRHRRNQIAHGLDKFLHESEDDSQLWSNDDVSDSQVDFQPPTLLKFADRISDLLETLEDVSTDSKLDSLVSLLGKLGVLTRSDRRVCTFTNYVDTATYLESAIGDQHSHVAAVTGSLSYKERERAVAAFAHNGGILIATSAMSIPLPEVAAVIFYDLPMNPTTLDARIGQFIRVGRSGPVHAFAFTDESETLIIERLQRRAIDVKQTLGSDEVQRLLFEASPNHKL